MIKERKTERKKMNVKLLNLMISICFNFVSNVSFQRKGEVTLFFLFRFDKAIDLSRFENIVRGQGKRMGQAV